ncbi:rho-related GTP-binding protein RhoN-like [Haliotis cracherodii]|uniref:rho-related GTP-binding protein RhoN-like n=1 Tax=Haliotis cracherodii TaxID=6455 RepID=UPI0039EBDE19
MKDQACSEFVFMPLKGDSARSATPTKETMSAPTSPDTESEVTLVRSKIVVVGDCSCGKTSLIRMYCKPGEFSDTYTPTGFDTFTSTYNVSETYRIQISIWDTSGDSGYDRVRPLSYTDADLIMVCFSVADPESMENVVSKWLPEVREHCPKQPLMLVGCKTDLRNEIKTVPPSKDKTPSIVSYDQGLKTAKHIGALVYSETASKTSQRSVNDVMEVAALSSAGTKGNTPEATSFRRQRSFIRRKRFSGMNEAKMHLRKEAAKSCVVM